MTPTEMIQRLYDLGHFHNPKYATGVTKADLPKLGLHHASVRLAIQSYQEFMTVDFDRLALEKHGRLGIADGEVGPATESLMSEPRCGFPDYPYPEGVMAAQQNANWPNACRGRLIFSRNFKALPGLSESQTDEVFHGMSNNWTYALDDVEIVSAGVTNGQGSHIHAGLKNLSGTTLAWSYLATNNCNDQLEQAYDTRNWDRTLGITVSSHEVGHALGLPHNRDGDALMYPSIHQRSLGRSGYPNATDLAQAKGLGYKLSGGQPPDPGDLYRPRPHTPTDPGPGDPPSGKLRFEGEFTAMIDNQEFGKFILSPKPEA